MSYAQFLAWLQHSALGHAMREHGVWIYGIVNFAHIAGVATLFGAVLLLDLRLLGVWRGLPLAGFTAAAATIALCGFALAAPAGIALFSTKATDYLGNPFIPIKFAAIALGIANMALLRFSPVWRSRGKPDLSARERRRLAFAGAFSLAFWTTALGAGRMIGYW